MPTQMWSTGSKTAKANGTRNDAGFTLIELVVVMSLVAVVSLAAVPAWQQFSRTWTLRGAVMSFSSLLRYAQLNAVEQAEERRVIVDYTAGTYRLVPISPDDTVEEGTSDNQKATSAWEVPRTLPATVRIESDVESDTNNSTNSTADSVEIVFRPDGSATATVLQMENASQAFRIEIRAATGAVKTTKVAATD